MAGSHLRVMDCIEVLLLSAFKFMTKYSQKCCVKDLAT